MKDSLDILIVDDCKIMRQMICRTIEICPFETDKVIEAADGKIGLYWANNLEFDLIIADLNMPVIRGSEMIAKMRTDPKFDETIIIIVSAESNGSRINIIKNMTDGFVHKPFTPEELRDEIVKAIQKSQREVNQLKFNQTIL
ncbi:response regulator [Gracilimonas sp. Q87]|uniref:response regulator n=1 Tax=Gracilimonas sp. Q87 TaxID=3384766 RepID=UPI0039841CF1